MRCGGSCESTRSHSSFPVDRQPKRGQFLTDSVGHVTPQDVPTWHLPARTRGYRRRGGLECAGKPLPRRPHRPIKGRSEDVGEAPADGIRSVLEEVELRLAGRAAGLGGASEHDVKGTRGPARERGFTGRSSLDGDTVCPRNRLDLAEEVLWPEMFWQILANQVRLGLIAPRL